MRWKTTVALYIVNVFRYRAWWSNLASLGMSGNILPLSLVSLHWRSVTLETLTFPPFYIVTTSP